MSTIDMNWSAPNILCVCVDACSNGEIAGRIYHRYKEEASVYRNIGEMLKIMEQLFDSLNYPQRAVRSRLFDACRGRQKAENTVQDDHIHDRKRTDGHQYYAEDLVPAVGAEEIAGQSGKVMTLLIHVQYRQKATWQGLMEWKECGKSRRFYSELELMKLIDMALKEQCGS